MRCKNLYGYKYLIIFVLLSGLSSCISQGKENSKNKEAAVSSQDLAVGVALYSFNRFGFPETIHKSQQADAEVVEGFFFHKMGAEFANKTLLELDDAELGKMKEILDQKGMEMRSMYAGGKSKEDWSRFYEIGQVLDLEFLVAEPEPEYWDYLDSLGRATGIRLAIHEHAKGKSRFWHPDSVLVAVEGRPSFGACGDLGHWVRSGLDPVECLKKLAGNLISIHAKDLDEFGNIEANDVKVSEGVIDYDGVIEELDRQRFSGPIYVECEHDWDDNLGDVKFAVEYLKRLASREGKN